MTGRTRSLGAGALVALAILNLDAPARAATLLWNNAAGGQAGVAGNWTPSVVPSELDLLRFNLGGAYTVTFGAAVDSVASHSFWSGDVTLNFNTPHGMSGLFSVAPQAGQIATARHTAGTLRLGSLATVGAGPGATGVLRVNGGTANLFQNASAFPSLNVGPDGAGSGSGEVVVLGGGVVELAGGLNLGMASGGAGTLRVRGLGSTGSGMRRSHFFADSPTRDCVMGAGGSNGVLEVLDGGLFRTGRDLLVSQVAGDVSLITIGGENAIDSSEVRVGDDLRVSVNPSALAGQVGGSATITLDSLGVLVVNDSTVVGDVDGSSAVIALRPHSRMITKHLILQQPGGGAVDLAGGRLQVAGGTLATSTGRLQIPGGAPSISLRPVLELISGATATFNGTTSNPPLVVGTTAGVEMKVGAGSHVSANGGSLVVGETLGADAQLTIADGGQFDSDRVGAIGPSGEGILHVETGGTATLAGLDLGAGVTGTGGLVVENPGSTLTLTGPLNMAGSALSAGNYGSVFVSTGGVVNLASPISGTVWPSTGIGDFQVYSSGLVNLGGLLTVRGEIELIEGDVEGGVVALRGSGRILGEGTVHSAILAGTDTTVTIEAYNLLDAELEIGNEAPGGGVLMRGRLDVNGGSVTVVDPDSAVLGVVEIANGHLHLPAGGGVIEAGKRIVGSGTIHGPLRMNGYLIASGGALQFDGMLKGTGQGASGDEVRFLAGGGFEGQGRISADVVADSGSIIRALGNLDLGNAQATDHVTLGGRIETGPYRVTFWDGFGANGLDLTGDLALAGGNVLVSFNYPLNVLAGGRVSGNGTLVMPLVSSGTMAPGASAGRLRLLGSFTMSGGALEVEVGRFASGEWDTLAVDGAATLSGTLDLRRLPVFAAHAGDSIEILHCASRTGTFASVTLDGAPLAGELEVHYATNGVWVVFLQSTVGVGDEPDSPAVSSLQMAAVGSPGPRPALELVLPSESSVTLEVFDVGGRRLGRTQHPTLAAGRHRVEPGADLERAGLYFVRASVVSDGRPRVLMTRVIRTR